MSEGGALSPPAAVKTAPSAAWAWLPLTAYFALVGLAHGVYAAAGREPSVSFEFLSTVALAVILWHWFNRQLAAHRPAWPMDMGVVIVAVWVLAMPYYLWRYERWRGLLKMLCVLGLYLVSSAAALVVWLALR